MTVEEIITRLDHFSTKELEKLAQEIRVILDARDENSVASFQRKRRRPMDPLAKLEQEAEDWVGFAKYHEVSNDTLYWAIKILIARDKRREIERKMSMV
ncbi:MAG: hypothetical protein QXS68_06590 [Candidatus Methanomethylicaceae archaeon]